MKALTILLIILAAPAVQAQDETQQIEDAFQIAWCSGLFAAMGNDGHGRGYIIAAGMLAESLVTIDQDTMFEVLKERSISGSEWFTTYQVSLTPEELLEKAQPCIDINPQVVELINAWRVAGVTK